MLDYIFKTIVLAVAALISYARNICTVELIVSNRLAILTKAPAWRRFTTHSNRQGGAAG